MPASSHRPRSAREPSTASTPRARVQQALLAYLDARGTSPARLATVLGLRLGSEDAVRAALGHLAASGEVDLYRHGRPLKALPPDGPVSIRSRGTVTLDHRAHPERYRIGRGEEGVLTVEPYKSELLPLWRFATEETARRSSAALWKRFVAYGKAGDFVGMDMARKFLQMGWTRARRYANHRGGRKYVKGTRVMLPFTRDPEKEKAASVFRAVYLRALEHPIYLGLRERHLEQGKVP